MIKTQFIFENVGGLDCFIIKKKGFKQKQCMLTVNYGSKDNCYVCENKKYNLPLGIAHFLEHKIFEKENENIFELFGNIGASVNAFTNFNSTAFYFNCIDNFKEGISILANMLNTPFFTKENVENEKNIINQEIKMYKDDPMWNVYFDMLALLYPNNPIKNNIAGSEESIKEITTDDLYNCYNAFYNKKNSALICCGDIDEKEVFKYAEKFFIEKDNKEIKFEKYESLKITEKITEKRMDAKRNIFNIGFNDESFANMPIVSMITGKILLDILFGRSSDFYEDMYENLMLDSSFTKEYNCTKDLGFYYLGGFSSEPLNVYSKVVERIKKMRENGITDFKFEIAKKSCWGKMLKEFNSINSLCIMQADLYSKKSDIKQFYDGLCKVSKKQVGEKLESIDFDKIVMSIIKPF